MIIPTYSLASQIMKGKPASPTAVPTPLTELHPPPSAPQRKSQRMARPPLHKAGHTLQDSLPGGNKSTAHQIFPPKKPRKTASWPPPKNPQISSNRLPLTKQAITSIIALPVCTSMISEMQSRWTLVICSMFLSSEQPLLPGPILTVLFSGNWQDYNCATRRLPQESNDILKRKSVPTKTKRTRQRARKSLVF